MSAQPEALRLAEILPQFGGATCHAAADQLRRLHAENSELLEALKEVVRLADEMHDHWDNDRDAKVGKCLMALSQRLPKYDTRFDKIHATIAKAEGRAATQQNEVLIDAIADMGRAAL